MHKSVYLLVLVSSVLTGCRWQPPSLERATPTLFVITSTLPPTPIPSITFTPIPPTPSPTTAPIAGLTTTQVNVRDGPSTTGAQFGVLAPFIRVQIVGRDTSGDWYEILYSEAPTGLGWVTAQYINVQNKDGIPVVGAPAETATPPDATGTPSASGTIVQQVNVRKGPGTDFESLGIMNARETAELVGKDASGSWLQIRYAAAPDGKGWIAAAYIQASGLEALPTISESGQVAATGTPMASLPTITATPAVALQDNDSAQAPAASITLSPAGTHALIYSSDVSGPEGDAQDFVGFTSFSAEVLMSLTCAGDGTIKTGLQSGGSVTDWPGLSCGQTQLVSVAPGRPYIMDLSIVAAGAGTRYVRYTIRIESSS